MTTVTITFNVNVDDALRAEADHHASQHNGSPAAKQPRGSNTRAWTFDSDVNARQFGGLLAPANGVAGITYA